MDTDQDYLQVRLKAAHDRYQKALASATTDAEFSAAHADYATAYADYLEAKAARSVSDGGQAADEALCDQATRPRRR